MISRKFALGCAGAVVLAAGAAQAQTTVRAPTLQNIQQVGQFAVQSQNLPANGFGGGTIFFPATAGQYAAVAFCPGFTLNQSSNRVQAQRLASHGFVVATINTNSGFDLAQSRGTQLRAALRSLRTVGGTAGTRIDRARVLGVAGHSMGGGGALFALLGEPQLTAGMLYAPFSSSNPFGGISGDTITTVVANNDGIAPANQHSIPFFNATTQLNDATLCQTTAGGHNFVSNNPPQQPSSRLAIATFSVRLNGDTRFAPLLANSTGCATFRQ